ncbi:MAG: 3-oxoadipate enol-lactonase [Candidatus Puniceispirillaceae bacterium]
MQFVSLNNITLHYQQISGPEDAPAIVFINSLATDFRIWRDVIVQLAGKFPMLTYDKRGHGLSDIGQSPYQIDDHVNDLVALMDRLKISNAVICGLSVGGLIAMRLSKVRPDLVSSLVLCDTAPKIGTEPMWEERMEIARHDGMAGLLKANMERWFTRNFHTHHTAELDGYSNMFLRVPIEGYLGTAAAIRDTDLREDAAKIDLPVMCVVGEEDGSTPPELVLEMANMIPGADFKLIKGAGHIPCVEQPHVLADTLTGFILSQK